MKKNLESFPLGVVALVALAVLSLVAAPGIGQEEKKVRVKVHKIDAEECQGDCEDVHVRKILVGADGVHEISDDGENVFVMKGGSSEPFVWHAAHSPKAFLGIGLTELTADLRQHFGVAGDGGVMVSKVVDDSPAFRAGLEVGDIVSAVDGEVVASASALSRAIGSQEEGDQVTLEVWRDGQMQNLTATLDEAEGGGHVRKIRQQIKVQCDDEGGDCDVELGDLGDHKTFTFLNGGGFDCEGGDCEITVDCSDDSCSCTVNGEETDCETLGH